jgi:hypothetical protein
MYATTRQFLDYFNLKSLDQLPALADIRDVETLNAELGFSEPVGDSTAQAAPEAPATPSQAHPQMRWLTMATTQPAPRCRMAPTSPPAPTGRPNSLRI